MDKPELCAACGRPATGQEGGLWFCQDCLGAMEVERRKPIMTARDFLERVRRKLPELPVGESEPDSELPAVPPYRYQEYPPTPVVRIPEVPAERKIVYEYVPAPAPVEEAAPVVIERIIERPVQVPVYIHSPAPEPAPVQTMPPARPEVPRQPAVPAIEQPEVETESEVASPAPVPTSTSGSKPEEKSSFRKNNPPKVEEKTSGGGKKRRVRYEGEGGRIHTEAQIDELLDFYLMTGELPIYVSPRQQYDYRHHKRLPERRELLESRGIPIVVGISGTAGRAENVIPIKGTKPQRKAVTSH